MKESIPGDPPFAADRLVALLAVRGGRVLLVVPGRERWIADPTCTFVPLELPGGQAHDGESDAEALNREVHEGLCAEIAVRPAEWSYGPSSAHAIDRRPVLAGRIGPLAETRSGDHAQAPLSREAPPWTARIYRGVLLGSPRPGTHAGTLWLAPAAMRAVVRGRPFGDLLATPGACWTPLSSGRPPDDALTYLPSTYGERYLLRAAGKYGADAVFAEEAGDGAG